MRSIEITRYVTPLREGGSLPAIVEADDDGLYVLKFRAAGHGAKALVAELVAGEIARALGLPVPEIVLATLDADLARTEPDPEIHALIYDSAGLNLALDYLPGAVSYDPAIHAAPSELAARIVWFDAYVTNVDRTARNTNLLIWHRAIWLIDHGSTLYFHHSPNWEAEPERARNAFEKIAEHVLLRRARDLERIDEMMAAALTPSLIDGVLALVPDDWLANGTGGGRAEGVRASYRRYLLDRLAAPRGFVQEAARVR